MDTVINSFSAWPMYEHLAGTRCKPWDNRELDTLDGGKMWAYIVVTPSQTAFMMLYMVISVR